MSACRGNTRHNTEGAVQASDLRSSRSCIFTFEVITTSPKRQYSSMEDVSEDVFNLSVEDQDQQVESSSDDNSVDSAAEDSSEGEDPELDHVQGSSEDSDWEPGDPQHKRPRMTPTRSTGPSQPPPSTSGFTPRRGKGRSHRGRRKAAASAPASTNSSTPGWHSMNDEDVDPPSLPFKPKRKPGPQIVSTASYTPMELFQLFFTSTMLKTVLNNSNAYGAIRQTQKPWQDINLKDLYSFLAIVIYTGLVKCSSLSDYWRASRLYSLPLPTEIMARRKFLNILAVLHPSDPKVDAENDEKKGTPAYDRLCKIKPLYEQILEACKSNFHPFQSIAVDERMAKSKARCSSKHCVKNKPRKWGYKLFVLADSSSGYTWNFFVYDGKSAVEQGQGLSYDSVMKLVEQNVLGTGYKLFVDNFYTSPTLFKDLHQKKILACGTIRPVVIGLPNTAVNTMPRNAPRGTMEWIRQNELLFVRWMDTREVVMCSTMHKAYEGDTVNRRVKGADGQWTIAKVPIPAAVKDYKKSMGGADISDALISYYNIIHKTRKWYKKLFYHFVDIAIVNAFILHCHISREKQQKQLTQKDFRERLVLQLIDCTVEADGAGSSASAPASGAEASTPFSACGAEPSPFHKPQYIQGDSTVGRRRCTHCQQKTPVMCVSCQVSLCFVPKRDCFNQWHDANGL